jgi:hypothetical protein
MQLMQIVKAESGDDESALAANTKAASLYSFFNSYTSPNQ